jgi:hypothetical protein
VSNTAACARPASGRTEPAGAPDAGGDTAASAGVIVGGASAWFDVHADVTAITSMIAKKRITRLEVFT